ncbi:CarD family transcriptional regulator [Caloramator australicus]|uniref:Transcriptional regulator, CarD family n=1 Tax=Caloramator australicus RC3 TaxID=857293 RepID=G0V3X5_9CLOT|nr:CarD family transcriptional regulator [Caloramator australicus]CCC57815.1 transcriptional regulator, CarD family [Caloramator australicus RC3]
MFEIGDKVFVKNFGGGVITNIQEKNVNGIRKKYYEIKLVIDNICIYLPIDEKNKIRGVIERSKLEDCLKILKEFKGDLPNKCIDRYKLYKYTLEQTDPIEMAKLIKCMDVNFKRKKPSNFDKNNFEKILNTFCSEICLVLQRDFNETKKIILENLKS